MRKSFTRFLSVFMLFCAFGLQAAFAQSFDGASSIPKDGATNVKPGDIATQFVLAYSATPAITGTGTMVISKDGSILKVVPLTTANVTVAGKTLVVKHGIASFTEKSLYSITVSSGVTVGGSPVTIGVGDYSFTIGDFTPPVLASTNPLVPADGATGVKANLPSSGVPPGTFTLVMNFNEPIALGTGDIAVYNANGTVMDIIRVGEDGAPIVITNDLVAKTGFATITLSNNAYFAAQNDYYVKVDAGSITDISPNLNKYAGITTNTAWNWATRDESSPVITATVSSVAATTANLNVAISEAGKVSYLVKLATDPVPVIGDFPAFTAQTANTNKVYALTGLTGASKYVAYVVSENNETPPNVSGATANQVTFTTKDNTGPVSQGRGLITTAKKTTGAYYTFNEQVVGGSGSLAVRKVSDNTLIYSVPASAVTCAEIITSGGVHTGVWKAVMNFGGALASNEDYYIVFPIGYIKDMSGNSYVNTNNPNASDTFPGGSVPVNYTDWVVTSSDFEAPVVTFTTPALLTDDILINFNEDVVLADGNPWTDLSVFSNASKYVSFQKGGINVPATFSYSGMVLTIHPTSALTSNTDYTVVLHANAVKDVSPNANVLADAQTKVFTTGDLDVLAATFAPDANIVATTPLVVNFNKAVRAIRAAAPGYEALTNTNVETTFTLVKNVFDVATDGITSTTVDPADYNTSYDATGHKITVVPASGKSWATSSAALEISYTLNILVDKIEDNGGANLAPISNTWNVDDYKKPVATLVANELLFSDPLTISFDEPVTQIDATDPLTPFLFKLTDAQGNNLPFSVSSVTTGLVSTVYTIVPDAALVSGKTYYYGVGANMQDASGNVNVANYKSFKAVGVALPPTVDAVTYTVNGGASTPIADIFKGVTVNGSGKIVVKVNFNTAVRPKDLTAVNTVATTLNGAGVVITPADVSGQVLTITITPSPAIASSDPGTSYTVTIPQFLVEANAAYTGTTFAQMGGNVVITVKTKDTQLPTVTANLNGLTGVALDAGLKLTFSEPVTPVAGQTIKFNYGSGPTTAETVSITSSNVVKDATITDGTVWVVKHANFDQYNTLYTIVVAKGAFLDATSNNLGAADVTFTFTTVTNTPPTIATLNPAHLSDNAPLSLDMNIVFNKPVVQASITGSRKLVYVIKQVGGTADATINPVTGDLVLGGDDVQKFAAYVDQTSIVVVDGATVTIKGVTLEAGSNYYVLITPGAFKDTALPTSEVQPFAGILGSGTWNFTTSDIYAPDVALSFTKLGTDGLADPTSDIKLTFTKAIEKVGGAAITNSSLPSLVKLEKWTGTTWQNLAYTGTISTDKKVITVDNSSLVLLGEMKAGTKYRVSYGAAVLQGANSNTALDAYLEEFWTTDGTAPAAPVVVFKNNSEATDIYIDVDGKDVIKLNIAATDVNSGLTDHTAINVYYLKSSTEAALSASDVKGLAQDTKSLAGDGNFDVTYTGGMTSGTSYYIYAVAEDVAGNLSAVTKFVAITDDSVKPLRIGALPTAFDKAGNITLVFNEAVVPAEGSYARVIDNATGIVYTMPLSQLDLADNAAGNKISIVGGEFVQMSLDVAHYTIEVDPGMILDVPRVVATVGDLTLGAQVNVPNAWDGIVGTSFQVASVDQVAPNLLTAEPNEADVPLMPTFTLTFDEAVNLNSGFTNYIIYEDFTPTLKTKSATVAPPLTAYDILTAANISGLGTSTITLNTNRALVSGHDYYLVIINKTFSDLSGNKWDNDGNKILYFRGLDNVPLAGTFYSEEDVLPTAPLSYVPNTLWIEFGESYFLNSGLDPMINTFDLQSHIYVNQDGTPVSFSAFDDGDGWIGIDLNLGDAAKGKTFTFGYVNLYDGSGNLNAGEEATFTVKPDAVVNREVTFIPGDNDGDPETVVNIPVDQTFKVQFNGLLYTYNVSYPLNNLLMTKKYLQDNNVFTMDGVDLTVVSLDVVGGKHVVTLQPAEPLQSETTYTLWINSLWDEDNAGIQIGQGTQPLDYYEETYRTADVVAPKLIADGDGVTLDYAYLPVKEGVVGKDQTLALVFDEKVVGAGVVTIHRWDGVAMATVDITGATSTDDGEGGWVLNIGKPSDIMIDNPGFITNVKYYVEVPAGAVQDVAAIPNSFAGIVTVNEWSFTLMDDSTPLVVFVDDTKDGMAVNTKIKLTFDRPVELGKGWLALYYTDGKAVDLIRTSPGVTSMTSYDFTLNRELAPDTKFFVELGQGTFTLAADNSIKQTQQSIGNWYFTTEVTAVPVAQTYVPAFGATLVPLTSGLSITFDQNVIPGTGNIQLHRKQDVGGPIITTFDVTDPTKVSFVGNTLTIDGSVLNLQNNSDYYVIIPATAVKNTSTDPVFWGGITVPFTWAFNTLNDVVAPTAVYAPKTTGLKPAEVVLTMTFNEAVVAGTGNLVIYNAATDAVVETIAITQSMLAGQVVTLHPTTLVESTNYYVQVSAGAIKDLAGNNFAGITNKTDWTFGTGDFTKPSVLSVSPTGTIADNHPTFVVTFDGPVLFGNNGNLKVFKVGSTTPTLNIPVRANMVSGSTVTVTYPSNNTLVGGLDKNTAYYVLVDAAVVKDAAGNTSPGITDPTAWTFTTGADFKTVIEPNVSLEFKVYPNPFVEYVDFKASFEVSKVVVTNIAGQTVKQVVNPSQRIQLNELRSGVYFMSVYDMDNTVKNTAKIVKR